MDATLSTFDHERSPTLALRPAEPRGALALLRGELPPVRVQASLDRNQMLDVTEACLDDLGYDGTTIRQIAGRLNCAVGTIYRYFKDKRELLTAVVQRRFEPVVQQIDTNIPPHRTAALYAHLAMSAPQQYRLMFWLASVETPGQVGVPRVVELILAGWARQLGDRAKAEQFWAQVHGSLMLGRTPQVPGVIDLKPESHVEPRVEPIAPQAVVVAETQPREDDAEDLTLL